ncbi:MAG: type II toxin-antitoxin system VapC family toxin [Methanosarcinales archaeon]
MTKYVADTHGIVWFLEKSPKLGKNAREVFLDEKITLIIPTIVLAEIKFLYNKQRFRTSLENVLKVIKNDPRCIVYPMTMDVVEILPISLNIHDAIIVGTALIFRNIYHEEIKVITKDKEIKSSGLIGTVW